MTEELLPKKKKKWEDIELLPDDTPLPVKEPLPPVVAQAPEYYTAHHWDGGVKIVYKCCMCHSFRDDTDAMIEHVLLHYPGSDQEFMLERLLAYKPKEV